LYLASSEASVEDSKPSTPRAQKSLSIPNPTLNIRIIKRLLKKLLAQLILTPTSFQLSLASVTLFLQSLNMRAPLEKHVSKHGWEF
jgi:hypothetical protein